MFYIKCNVRLETARGDIFRWIDFDFCSFFPVNIGVVVLFLNICIFWNWADDTVVYNVLLYIMKVCYFLRRIIFLHSEIYVMVLNDESFHFIRKIYISTIKLLDTCNNSLFYYITFIYFPYFNEHFAIWKSWIFQTQAQYAGHTRFMYRNRKLILYKRFFYIVKFSYVKKIMSESKINELIKLNIT